MDSVQDAVRNEAAPGPTGAASSSWRNEDREGHHVSVLRGTSLRAVSSPFFFRYFSCFPFLVIFTGNSEAERKNISSPSIIKKMLLSSRNTIS